MKFSLVVLAAGPMKGKVLHSPTPLFVIGRDPACHLRPASAMISKKHCALIVKDGKAFIKDFGSTNGSYVNDEKVEGHRELKQGDQLKIGPLFFEVCLEAATPAAKPAATSVAKPAATPAAKPAVAQAAAKSAAAPAAKPAAKAAVGKPAVPAAKTPVPAGPAEPESRSESTQAGDDDIAALWLSGSDDTVMDGPAAGDIPQGTTVFELPASKVPGEPGSEDKAKEEAKPAAPPPTNSEKAAAILDLMRKRPRKPNP
jgi:predicted component of type VI protein secretion system